jgi:hypothetical protein
MQVAGRFGKFVGDGGGDGGAAGEQAAGKSWLLPMMKVTAIVSPSARPSPSITAPIAPRRI